MNINTKLMCIKKIELRKAVPEDLKLDRNHLKIGQPYAIVENDQENISGLFVLDGTEDGFSLKMYLDAGQIYIPVENTSLMNFLKTNNDE